MTIGVRPFFSSLFKNADAIETGYTQALLLTISVRLFHKLEFIHAPADIRFGDVDVPFGVDVQRVAMRKFAELMAGAAELCDFVPFVIENVDKLIAAIGDDHVFLSRVARKA